ncbi:excalibur calcium-binding domain-containing protein [Pseudonocardia nematodicida]|uniref:Excalibur calcium-binding domain-containing protein n=1 Tax=Pseudonocardia nematodicida TaxID=1206997 RepID=A0ABV1K945_9PSEU
MTTSLDTALTQPIRVPDRRNSRATAGFWLGILSLLVGWFPLLGFVVTVPAVALSWEGRVRHRTGRAATPGRSGAGLAMGVAGSLLCVLTTVVAFVGAAVAPTPAADLSAAPVAPVAPVELAVPDVVGMDGVRAREALSAAGFRSVVAGPASGPADGVAPGTVTAQEPAADVLAGPDDTITLNEAAAAPAPPPSPPLAAAPPTEDGAPGPAAAPRAVAAPAPKPAPAPAPARAPAPAPAPRPAAAPAPRPVPAPAPAPAAPAGGGSAHYANCDAVRAAGKAPLLAGQPGYRAGLDRDGDGVACERG